MESKRRLSIRSAAVLGAGVMGRGIAAHLAGTGINVLLLDIVPPGETSTEPMKRNAFALGGLQAALKHKPSLFYHKHPSFKITTKTRTLVSRNTEGCYPYRT